MKEIIIPALVAAFTSIIISLIALYQFLKSQNNQRYQFEKLLNRDFTTKLYDQRLLYYPKAFEITDNIYKEKGGKIDINKSRQNLNNLIAWRQGVVGLIISNEALFSFYCLRDSLMKRPEKGCEYSEIQIDRIINNTKEFRRQLRRDIGFLFKEERDRRNSHNKYNN